MSPLDVHERLLKILPVRVHLIQDECQKLTQGKTRRVKIGNRIYESLKKASVAQGVSVHYIYRMIDDGRAELA